MRMSPDSEESVRCTACGCSCACFKPGSVQLRSCDRCGHGWVRHALAKLQLPAPPPSSCGPVEVALPGLVFDLSSLVLYGAQAVPVRLKILLDRLYSILSPEQVGHILNTLGWSLGDYVRGYMLQHPGGKVLDRWSMATPEDELLTLGQFLRFGETRPIVELMTLQCLAAVNHLSDPELSPASKSFRSNVGAAVERNGVSRNIRGDSRLVCRYQRNGPADHKDTVRHFENVPEGPSLLLPFHFPSSALHCLVPPTKELVPPSKLTQCLRKLSGTKLPERQERGGREEEIDPIVQQCKAEPVLKIKADPDRPNTTCSMWHQQPGFLCDQEPDLMENAASLSTTSSTLHPLTSSSPSKTSQKFLSSSSFPFKSLPSFSSSFLCPLPNSSFSSSLPPLPSSSSSLCPLPSSLCSFPPSSLSPAGGRKGRVCCGVCGKSFYDKGTLKIHYNAVHLKIKHRCTVAGCTMVFSSLRSRNRHSANPNPRLHTGAARDAHARNAHSRTCEDKDGGDAVWRLEDDARALTNGLNSRTNNQHGGRDNAATQAASPSPQPRHLTPPPLLPPPPSLVPLVDENRQRTNCTALGHAPVAAASDFDVATDRGSPPTGRQQQRRRWESGDLLPKKKPRKSSMPVKIAREKVDGGRGEEEEVC